MQTLFSTPIRKGKVRYGIYWQQYSNGIIHIESEQYCFYSIKDAVKLWRSKNKK